MQKIKYRLGLILVIMTVILVAAGCSATSVSVEQVPSPEPETSLDLILKQGVIRIGTEGTYAPFTFHDATGKLTGFDVEIAEEVAKRLGVKAEFIETKWDGMFAGLDTGRFDFVANQVGIREDRLEKYDFSVPYIVSRAVLIVHEDTKDIQSFADLDGRKSGQSLTSNLAEIAREYGAEIIAVDGFNQAIDLLLSKRIEATVNDRLSFLDFKKQRPEAPVQVAAEMPAGSQSGFLFNKGHEALVGAIDETLEEMMADGTYLEISEKWFGEDVSR